MIAIIDWIEERSPLEVLLAFAAAAVVSAFVLNRVVLRLTRRTNTDLDDRIVQRLRLPIFLTLLFVGVAVALRRFAEPPSAQVLHFVDAILITVGAFIWMRTLMRVADAVLDTLARRADDFRWIQTASLPLFEILTKLVLLGAMLYAVFLAWEIDVTAWLASAGIVGLAVGFAAKDTLANLFAGIFILADAPYKLGDFVILDSGERGRITDIGIRSTRLLTRDDIEITLPNAVIANAKIINETAGPHEKERVRVNVGVAYGSDIDRVREAMMEVANDCELLAQSPRPSVRFREFGDSALIFQLRGWIEEPVLRGRTIDRLNTAIYKRFQADGIEIPFPQRVVHMQQ